MSLHHIMSHYRLWHVTSYVAI